MIRAWKESLAQKAHDMVPTALVGLQTLKWVFFPQQTISAVGTSLLRRSDEQAPKEIQTTERVGCLIMATVLQSDYEGRRTMPKSRGARRSLLRVPHSGNCQPDDNLIRVKRQNGSRHQPHLGCRETAAGVLQPEKSGVSRETGRMMQSWKPRAYKRNPANGQFGCEAGGIKGVKR